MTIHSMFHATAIHTSRIWSFEHGRAQSSTGASLRLMSCRFRYMMPMYCSIAPRCAASQIAFVRLLLANIDMKYVQFRQHDSSKRSYVCSFEQHGVIHNGKLRLNPKGPPEARRFRTSACRCSLV